MKIKLELDEDEVQALVDYHLENEGSAANKRDYHIAEEHKDRVDELRKLLPQHFNPLKHEQTR